ncbi:MAG: surface-adhesin E family protein [Chakrabartia sp.]
MALAALLVASAAGAAQRPAPVEDWRLVNWSDETVLYIDHARLQPRDGGIRYWAKIVYLHDPAYVEIVSQVQMRCADRTYRNLSISGLYHGGVVHKETARLDWQDVKPGTNIEREMQHVCELPAS